MSDGERDIDIDIGKRYSGSYSGIAISTYFLLHALSHPPPFFPPLLQFRPHNPQPNTKHTKGVAGPGPGGHKKREAVRDQAKQIKQDDDAPPKIIPKSDDIRTLITNVVRSNILFSSYAQDEQSAIVDAFEPYQVDPDTFVIKQGEMGDNFYVVESGSLDIFIKN